MPAGKTSKALRLAPIPKELRERYPTTAALLDYWAHPYSSRLLRFLATRVRLNTLRGLPRFDD